MNLDLTAGFIWTNLPAVAKSDAFLKRIRSLMAAPTTDEYIAAQRAISANLIHVHGLDSGTALNAISFAISAIKHIDAGEPEHAWKWVKFH